MRVALLGLALTACGRAGFDPIVGAGDGNRGNGDGSSSVDATSLCSIAPGVPQRVSTSASQSIAPSIAWAGGSFAAAWHEDNAGNYNIYFAPLDAGGTKLAGEIAITTDGSLQFDTEIAWDGSSYRLAWNDARNGSTDIFTARYDAQGQVVDPPTGLITGGSVSADSSIAIDDQGFALSWVDTRDGNEEIYFARFDARAVQLGAELRITNTTSRSDQPTLIWDGAGYALTWRDIAGGDNEVYYALLDAQGTVRVPPQQLTNDPAESMFPTVVSTGTEYGIAWLSLGDDEHRLARIDGLGGVITNTPIASAPVQWKGTLAWNGSGYAAAYGTAGEVEFVEIDTNGTAGVPRNVTNDPAHSDSPALVHAPDGYRVVWQDQRDGNEEIYIAAICD